MENRQETGRTIHETVENQTIHPKEGRKSPTTREADSEHQTTPDPTVPTHRVQIVHEVNPAVAVKAQGVQEVKATVAIKAQTVQETAEFNSIQLTRVKTTQASQVLL